MYGSYHRILRADGVEGPTAPQVVAGNICESGDAFTRDENGIVDRELPLFGKATRSAYATRGVRLFHVLELQLAAEARRGARERRSGPPHPASGADGEPFRRRLKAAPEGTARRYGMKKTRVGILFGGRSVEHEVSLNSARNVLRAIDRDKYDVLLIAIDKGGCWGIVPEEVFSRLFEGPGRGAERLVPPSTRSSA